MGLLRRLRRREPLREPPCPRCGEPAPLESLVCTACGWDLREGYHDPVSGDDAFDQRVQQSEEAERRGQRVPAHVYEHARDRRRGPDANAEREILRHTGWSSPASPD